MINALTPSTQQQVSELILPGHPQPQDPGMTHETTKSGLVIVKKHLSPVTKGSQLVIVKDPLTSNSAVDAAKDAYKELAASQGTAAADILAGEQMKLAQQIQNKELRTQAVEALLAGDFARAFELMAQASKR